MVVIIGVDMYDTHIAYVSQNDTKGIVVVVVVVVEVVVV